MPSSTIWRNPGCCFIQYGTNTKWSDLEFEIFFKNSEIQSSEVPSSTIWRNPGCFFIQYGRLKTILCRPWPLPLCKVYSIEDAPTFSARRQPPPTSSPPFPHVQLWTSGLHPGWLRVPIPQVVGSARLYQDQLRVRKDQPGINSKVPENGHELTCSVDLGCPAHQAS